MPYSYGKENLRQDTGVSTRRREPELASPEPYRVGRREPGLESSAPRRVGRREPGSASLEPRRVGRREPGSASPALYRVERRTPGPASPALHRIERREPGRESPVLRRVGRRKRSRLGHTNFQIVFGICLIVFALAVVFNRMLVSNQSAVLQFFPSSQVDQTHPPMPLSFPVKEISRSVTAFSQADKTHYNNEDPEWSLWSNSACSGCAMAALMDAYGATINGRPLNCGDVLEAEYRLSVYRPLNDWGLVKGEPGELAQAAAKFGFTGHYTQKLSLDDLITLANAGIPSIVRIPTHVMVLSGGDSQNVFLADSGGLHLSKVTRTQFLHGLPGSRLYAGQSWMVGWYIILTPNNNNV